VPAQKLLDMAIEKALQDKREPLMLDRFVNLSEHLKSQAHAALAGYIANMSQEPAPPDLSTANMHDRLIDAAYEYLLIPAMHDLSTAWGREDLKHLWEEVPEVAKRREDLKHRSNEIEGALSELESLMDTI